LDDERFNSQEYMDEKLEILEKNGSFDIHQDHVSGDDRVRELEHENGGLRAKLAALEQEMQTRSPTKKKSASKTPAKKVSKAALEEVTSTNVIQNPFLASLKVLEKDTLVLRPSVATDSEENAERLSEISPRKLSLRNRSSVMEDASQPQTPTTVKKKRVLKSKKWEVDDDVF
jgi:hypothetical protein